MQRLRSCVTQHHRLLPSLAGSAQDYAPWSAFSSPHHHKKTLLNHPLIPPPSLPFLHQFSSFSSLAFASLPKSACIAAHSAAKESLQLFQHYAQCYWQLSKGRLSMLVVATTGAGFVMGSGELINWVGLSSTCMGTMLVAAAANSINQILEVDNDSRMKRTLHRPLPAGRIGLQHAFAWAFAAGISGIALLASEANMIAAGLGASNLALYTLVYTPLKQVHPINTWVGAVVGAVPPILGWVAAAGEIESGAWVLASALYFWQIPHFMAIAYLCRHDYAVGGFKMLSVADSSGQKTALVALRNSVYLLPLGFLAYNLGVTTEWFAAETALLSTGMAAMAGLFYFNPCSQTARQLFRVSLLYLPLLMMAILFHRRPNQHSYLALVKENENRISETTEVDYAVIASEEVEDKSKEQMFSRLPSKPPIAYMSAAPFPFLPTPKFGHD